MNKPDWKDAPVLAEFARHWLGRWQWFRRHTELNGMWQAFEHGKWVMTPMDNCAFISLVPRP